MIGRLPLREPQVLVVTKGHDYDHAAFSEMLDALDGIACTQVEQPAAQALFTGSTPSDWDAFLMYDMPGYEFQPDHSAPHLFDPPEQFRHDFENLVERGHGFVFLHHALAAWPTWEEYGNIMGGRFRFTRSRERPDSGYRHAVPQRVSILAPGHPIVAGLEDGFDIEDEVYLCEINDQQITPLLGTDAELTDQSVWSVWNAVLGERDTNHGWRHPTGSGVAAWVREHPCSRIVYLQFGDSPAAFANTALRRLLSNALAWVARVDQSNAEGTST